MTLPRHISKATLNNLHFPLQDFDVFAAQQPDTAAAAATPEPTSQTGLAAAAALVHGAPSPTPTTPTPPAGADLGHPDTVAAQTVALIHAEQTQQQPQTQVATIGQEKSTQEKVSERLLLTLAFDRHNSGHSHWAL